jgi:hypothetical protein
MDPGKALTWNPVIVSEGTLISLYHQIWQRMQRGSLLFLSPNMGDDAWRTVTIATSLLSPLQ